MRLATALFALNALLPLVGWTDNYEPTPGFYAGTVGLTGNALDSALHTLVKGQTVRSYAQARTDLAVTDRDWSFPPPANNPTGCETKFF